MKDVIQQVVLCHYDLAMQSDTHSLTASLANCYWKANLKTGYPATGYGYQFQTNAPGLNMYIRVTM